MGIFSGSVVGTRRAGRDNGHNRAHEPQVSILSSVPVRCSAPLFNGFKLALAICGFNMRFLPWWLYSGERS